MKKLFLFISTLLLVFFFTLPVFARCAYYGPPYNKYRCMPDKSEEGAKKNAPSGGGISQLDLTISCGASGSAVDWINTASLNCGDGNRYDALAVQKDATTLSAYFRQVPPGKSCAVTVSSGFDSKEVGSVETRGAAKQTLSGRCAW